MRHPNQQAKTSWIDGNIPLSNRFDDTYYSQSDGRAETGHVFINGNQLPTRWSLLPQCTIGELGFGTGLNFLQTVDQWNRIKSPGARLNFVSFELYPLATDAIAKALSRWGELDALSERLCKLWRFDQSVLSVQFFDDINLKVHFGDANELLGQPGLSSDAWYLDGFSPAKNPELWNEQLMGDVYRATKPGGTFATYSVAGFVRRNLQAAGFNISRQKGFGTKREMLTGYRD